MLLEKATGKIGEREDDRRRIYVVRDSTWLKSISERWWGFASAGDLESAWRVSDELLGAKIDLSHLPTHCRPIWDGRDPVGQPVAIRCWRGLGDAIQWVRYVPLLRKKASYLIVECESPLLPLFRAVDGFDELLALEREAANFPDVVGIESTELPYVFRTTLDSIPNEVPYLHFSQAPKKSYSPQVGVCWQGGTYDPRRSIPLRELAPVFELQNVELFQLQRGPARNQMEEFPLLFVNAADNSPSLLDTAALVQQMDLIITVDTMVAHLAGALGRPVWTLLHSEPDWRWFQNRTDSPWYPTMRLFRQAAPSDWKTVIKEVRAALLTWSRSFGSINPPGTAVHWQAKRPY